MNVRFALLAVLAAGAILSLAACGGGGTSTEGQATGTPLKTTAISGTDFSLDPSTITLDQGGTYSFDFKNDGQAEHALEIEGNGVEAKTETIGAGESASVTVDLQPGTYTMFCPVGNHRDLGMEGQISVGG
jgi:uncharacterized cupredoxin-like copper-binding protein